MFNVNNLPQKPVVQFSDQLPMLIHQLYSALSDPQGFHGFLDAISASVNGCSAQLAIIKKNPIQLEHAWYSDLNDGMVKWYIENNMIEQDIVSNHAVTQAPGKFQSAIPLLPEFDLNNKYERWESEQNMLDSAWLVIESNDDRMTLLAIQRTIEQGIYHQSELESLNLLIPYIRQSLQLYRHTLKRNKISSSLAFLFEHISDATFVLDGQANILYSNAPAKQLLKNERCFHIDQTRFHFPEKKVQQEFIQSSIQVARSSIGKGDFFSQTIFLQRSDKEPLTLVITPLKGSELITGGAIVTVYDRSLRPLPKASEIAAYFSLSPAESLLCEDLLTGLSLKDVAIKQYKSEATLRTYLKNVFQKTGHKSQGQLISCVLCALLH